MLLILQLMYTTAFFQSAGSEIYVNQSRQLSKLFLKPMFYSDLQIPAGFHPAFFSLFVI